MPCSSGHTGEFRVIGEREAADLERANRYLTEQEEEREDRLAFRREREKADRIERGLEPQHWPANLLTEIFGPYTCTRCCSYLHDTSDHRSQYGEAPPR